MSFLYSLLYATCITASIQLIGEIVEVNHFHEITDYVQHSSLVILDIDDTLLIPEQTLGNDAWFIDRTKDLIENKGMKKEVAFQKTIWEWEAIRKITKVQIVEKNTDAIIQHLQKNNIAIMGLTTQGICMSEITPWQLLSLNIDLNKTSPYKNDYYFRAGQGVLYTQGILFTSGTKKGKALLSLLKHINFRPDHVVFINDKLTHLQDVEESLEDENIKYTGLRYSYSDERVANYSREIANIQMETSNFECIISDEEAKQIAVQRKSIKL